MYLLDLYFESSKGVDNLCFIKENGKLRKWTQISSDCSNLELLQLLALACGGAHLYKHLPCDGQWFFRKSILPLRLECAMDSHPHDESSRPLSGSGILIDPEGKMKLLKKKDCRFLPSNLFHRTPNINRSASRYFILGYGAELRPHHQTDDFDFIDPFFRVTRFHSLFSKQARLTDPIAFLSLIHFKGVRYKRLSPNHAMQRLCRLFKEYLSIDTAPWKEKPCDFTREWSQLKPWQQRAALPALDAARHLLDAFPKSRKPLDMPGLVLLNCPDSFCGEKILPQWIMLMDQLLPKMQFVITLSAACHSHIPGEVQKKSLLRPDRDDQKQEKAPARMPPGVILLIDIDSRLPNLAMMKLSRYFKEQGRKVILDRKESFLPGAEAVYASCVFSFSSSQTRTEELRRYYGQSLILGGSGVDIQMRLPDEIEKLPADYTLYPELEDRAIGFITRGCPFHCPFCIVPRKEGNIHQVADIKTLLGNGRHKLILLDDNILSHPKAEEFLEEMVKRNLQINFTQTLDVRFINKEKAQLIRLIHCANTKFTRTNYHLSLNDNKNLDLVRQKYEMLGFTRVDNVEFICMYGYNTTLAEDVERFRFLKSLPGAYVFVQEYRPISGGPPTDLTGYFNDRADELINELVGIIFTQNMKSMEKYYHWLCKRYVRTFGKLHMGLVDTLFRYNNRHRKGQYMATMAGTIKKTAKVN